ncbi:arylsulfatase B [Rhodoplanes sp. Z2-YC6860]|uniref:arylsulfatase B n=1 Tax=Rhodoplanes sp. Z2-YC6860 TaxID=674703 RepID=UPI000A00683C|nr:arylsulfatase [Rhodoplanes sp. Z2-YC6860]
MKAIRIGVALGLAAFAGWLASSTPSQAQPLAPSARTIDAAQSGAAEQQSAQRPNIIYILADDLGWKDLGFHGSDIKTPNIDQLAQDGVKLEQFYVQPMCTPTRAALMTGRYPLRYGLQTLVIPGGSTYGLPTDEWLMPQMLKEAGYTTEIIGKWHLGHAKREFWPMQRGFDYQYGSQIGEIDYFTHMSVGKNDWYRDNKPLQEKGYVTTLLGDDAVRLIDRQDLRKPLFMYLAFTAPHAPYQAPQAYLDRYKHISDPNRRAYAAMITAMDDQIGRVVQALDKRGMRQNTMIVFHSDNGGNKSTLMSGESEVKGPLPSDNGPLRGGKGDLYEGGVRVPSLVNWPGHIKPGTVVNQMIHVVDYYPTIARLAGASTAKSKPLDGFDVWQTIAEGKPSPRDEVVYNVEAFRGAVRKGDWKLVWRSTLPSKIELFNLANDPYEKSNLAEQNPEKVAELQKRIDGLASEMARSLLLTEVFQKIVKGVRTTPPALPNEDTFYQQAD